MGDTFGQVAISLYLIQTESNGACETVMSKQSLMPAELTSPVSGDMLTEQEVTDVLGKVYDSIDDDLIRATSINGLLCISCTDETRLQKAKKHMVRHGSILRDYRKKENANGRVIYTYIFSKP